MQKTYDIDVQLVDSNALDEVFAFKDYFGKNLTQFYSVTKDSDILYEYAPEVKDFIRSLYEANIVQPFNWVEWKDSADARYLMSDPNHIKEAGLEELMKLLIIYLRSEQFIGGQLREAIESGFVYKILDRMESLFAQAA